MQDCSNLPNIIFALDVLGSAQEVHENIVRFAQHAVYGLDFKQGEARVGMVTYGDSAEANFYLNKYNIRYCLLCDNDIAVGNYSRFVEVNWLLVKPPLKFGSNILNLDLTNHLQTNNMTQKILF